MMTYYEKRVREVLAARPDGAAALAALDKERIGLDLRLGNVTHEACAQQLVEAAG